MGLWLQISLYKRPNISKGAMNVCTSFEIAMFQQKPGQNENRRIAVHDFPFVCISFIIHIMVWQKYGPINRGQSNCARKYVFDVFTMIVWRLYLYISACNICVLWGAYCPNTHFVTYYMWVCVCACCVCVCVCLCMIAICWACVFRHFECTDSQNSPNEKFRRQIGILGRVCSECPFNFSKQITLLGGRLGFETVVEWIESKSNGMYTLHCE